MSWKKIYKIERLKGIFKIRNCGTTMKYISPLKFVLELGESTSGNIFGLQF